MDSRFTRRIAKDIGVSAQARQEIARILQEEDYSAPFPLGGRITYAVALILIDVLEDHALPLNTCFPVALTLIDRDLCSSDIAPGSIKRACQRRIKSGKSLHDEIDSLYAGASNTDEIGPFCTKLGITKQWLHDQHQYELALGTNICNGVILDLLKYMKSTAHVSWTDARKWLCRLYPNTELCDGKTIMRDWQRLNNKKNSKGNKSLRQELLEGPYKVPQRQQPRPSASQTTSHVESQPDESSNVDICHQNYDSPIKQELVSFSC